MGCIRGEGCGGGGGRNGQLATTATSLKELKLEISVMLSKVPGEPTRRVAQDKESA